MARLSTRLLGVALGAAWLAGAASAQSLPVDQMYCNVRCGGPFEDAICQLGLAGGGFLVARRGSLAPLPTNDGVVAGGNLAIPTTGNPADDIVLAESYIDFRFSAPGPSACQNGFDIVHGMARLPVPAAGLFADADIEIVHQPMASIGYDLGRNLIAADSPWCTPDLDCACTDLCLKVPVPRTERHYFFFDVDARYSFRLGAAVLDSPGGAATLIFDPTDPYFFLTASVMGLPGVRTPLNAGSGGFGLSFEGNIPYVPVSTFGFEDREQEFRGDAAFTVAMPLFEIERPHLSIELDGTIVWALDPDKDGDHPITSPLEYLADPDMALGANGQLSVSWSPFDTTGRGRRGASKPPSQKKVQSESKKAKKKGLENPFLGLDLQLVGASASERIHPTYKEVFLSGRVGLDSDDIFPSWLPLPVRGGAGLSLAGYFTDLPGESYVMGLGELEIDPTFMGKLAKAGSLSRVQAQQAELRVDNNGFLIVGRSSSRLHRDVEPAEPSEVEAYVAPNGYDSHLAFRGPMVVAGERVGNAELILGPKELGFSGTWTLDRHTLELEGRFKSGGGKLTGSTTIQIPYSREDTIRQLELARLIADQEEIVDLAEGALAVAGDVFADRLAASQVAERDLDAAIAEIESWEALLAAIDAEIRDAQGDLDYQVRLRNCNADYGGCRSCPYNCDCSCSALDFACHARCATCSTAYAACQTEREACRVANIVGCTADRTFQIARLSALIAAKATERFGIQTAHDVALAVLEPAREANEVAQRALEAAVAAAEAAQAGLDVALAALDRYEHELDNLPDIHGTVGATLSVELKTSAKGATKKGKLAATWNGRKIAKGRVDLNASPRIACLTIPVREVGEICTTL